MWRRFTLMLVAPLLVACEAMVPVLSGLAAAIGQDLIAAASINHSPRYALQLEQLLIALTQHTTGVQMQGQLAAMGYQPPPPKWAHQQQQGQGYGQSGYPQGYPQQGYPQQGAPAQNYPAQNYPAQNYPSQNYPPQAGAQQEYPQQDYPTQDYPQTGYPQEESIQGDYTTYDQNAYDEESYDQTYDDSSYDSSTYEQSGYDDQSTYDENSYDQSVYDQTYDPQVYNAVVTRSARSIQLNTALLARRAGTSALVQIEEGDTLVDGGANPADGDLLKVHFQANCACYVYIIGIDATGYAVSIYPDPSAGHQNPVRANETYLVPGGDDWWGLDQQKGVEQVIFLASRNRRDDVEGALSAIAQEPRSVTADYQPVTGLGVPNTRGLVKVTAKPTQVASAGAPIQPSLFTTEDAVNEIVVTRWFYHR